MAQYSAFRRMPVSPQAALQVQTITLPAPTRGIVQDENFTFMKPGAAIMLDNWKPTLQGISLRGGCTRWCDLHSTGVARWANSTSYPVNTVVFDAPNYWKCTALHTSPATGSFAAYRTANPGKWVDHNPTINAARLPVISSFNYASGINERMFAAQPTKLFDVTTSIPTLVAGSRTSGNYAAAQMSNAAGEWLIAVNDAGDPPLRYNGSSWENMHASYVPPGGYPSKISVNLTTYPGAKVANGQNLIHVCKYRNRLFFIELNSMNAWYLGIDAVGGDLNMIPLSGSASHGGRLIFSAVWSLDAGDGTDDKIVFVTNLGELLIFTGGDPGSATGGWRQEGRYQVPPPLGMNAHMQLGGDLMIATLAGIVPTSAAISKGPAELELAAITQRIRLMWRTEAIARREHPWSMCDWPEYGGIFVTNPGMTSTESKQCMVVNSSSGAWTRFTGWDARCFIRMGSSMFFGTRNGLIMQADRTGYDDGLPYTATMVGGWEMFSSPSQTCTWVQARASFSARPNQPFVPQITATTDYVVTLPTAPHAGADITVLDLWDEGRWDEAKWDNGIPPVPVVRNTGWLSVGMTGYSHAPILQVTVAQSTKPDVDLISIAATFNRMGINV